MKSWVNSNTVTQDACMNQFQIIFNTLTLTFQLKVKCDRIYDFLLVFNSNIWPNSAPIYKPKESE